MALTLSSTPTTPCRRTTSEFAEPALDPSTTWMIGNPPRPDVLTVGSLRDLPEHF